MNRTNAEWESLIDSVFENCATVPESSFDPGLSSHEVAQLIDHTLLKIDATPEAIDKLCDEAIEYKLKTCCVRPDYVSRCVNRLRGSNVGVAAVVGFHEGTYPIEHKISEALKAVQDGASELDMVINHPLLHGDADYTGVFRDVKAVRDAAPTPTVLKCILETSRLSPREIVAGCVLAAQAGVDFVKTSTGFDGPGATVENVGVMKNAVAAARFPGVRVKASGGVRELVSVNSMVKAGAERIGTSSGVGIMKEVVTGKTSDSQRSGY